MTVLLTSFFASGALYRNTYYTTLGLFHPECFLSSGHHVQRAIYVCFICNGKSFVHLRSGPLEFGHRGEKKEG